MWSLPSFSFDQAVSEEIFVLIDQPEAKIACGAHACLRIGTKWAIFI